VQTSFHDQGLETPLNSLHHSAVASGATISYGPRRAPTARVTVVLRRADHTDVVSARRKDCVGHVSKERERHAEGIPTTVSCQRRTSPTLTRHGGRVDMETWERSTRGIPLPSAVGESGRFPAPDFLDGSAALCVPWPSAPLNPELSRRGDDSTRTVRFNSFTIGSKTCSRRS